MTLPLVLLVLLLVAWVIVALVTRRDAAQSSLVKHELRRVAAEGELLPALRPSEPDWLTPSAPVVRIPAPAPVTEIETRRPHRAPSLESDVWVPLAQAGATAIAACIAVSLMAWGIGWSWRVVVIVTGAVLALSWLWRLRLVDGLLWSVESYLQHDVNRDGRIGAPHIPIVVNPSVARGEVAALATENTSASRRRDLLAFVARCYTVGTSEAAHGLKGGGHRDDYKTHRDVLLRLGIAAWKNPERPASGWRLVVEEPEAARLIEEHVL